MQLMFEREELIVSESDSHADISAVGDKNRGHPISTGVFFINKGVSVTGQDIGEMIQLLVRLINADFRSALAAEHRPENFFRLSGRARFGFQAFVLVNSFVFRRFLPVGSRRRDEAILVDRAVEDEHRAVLIFDRLVSEDDAQR